jgi:hypothetical protein
MKRFVITEEDRKHIMGLYEQLALLNIEPKNIYFGSGDHTKQIKLKGVDPKTKQPLILKYNIMAKFGFANFGVNIRRIYRESDGAIRAQVLPDNILGKNALKLIPDKFKSADGWLNIAVPGKKIFEAISQLIKNKGTQANLDAGHGVVIKLTVANT